MHTIARLSLIPALDALCAEVLSMTSAAGHRLMLRQGPGHVEITHSLSYAQIVAAYGYGREAPAPSQEDCDRVLTVVRRHLESLAPADLAHALSNGSGGYVPGGTVTIDDVLGVEGDPRGPRLTYFGAENATPGQSLLQRWPAA